MKNLYSQIATRKILICGFIIAGLILSILLIPSTSSISIASTVVDETGKGDPTIDTVAMYAEGLNVSYEEAEKRFFLQDEFGKFASQIEAAEPAFGGAWIEHEPIFRLNVAFNTENGGELLEKYLRENKFIEQIEIHYSLFTLEELRTIRTIVKEELRTHFSMQGEAAPKISTGISQRYGRVKVHTQKPEVVREQLTSNLALQTVINGRLQLSSIAIERNPLTIVNIKYQEHAEFDSWPNYYAGTKGTNPACTAGLAVKDIHTNKKYVASAAHCDEFTIGLHSLGAVVDESPFPESDVKIQDAESLGWTITNRIKRYPSGNLGEYIISHIIRSQIREGTYVTRRGWNVPFALIEISDLEAGRNIDGIDLDDVFVEGVLPTWIFNYNNTQIACGGDSGGPVFRVTSYPNALGAGVHSYSSRDSNGECTYGADAYAGFAPVDIFPQGKYVPLGN